ncbi:Hypothetical_protein [Hexamita inflata]|uniref:Hypothetical_protein n=1 Tax=Hexamita inflata TaxID=28002 RepID=A0AA86PV84_9EUKA|nr:Hypothetical protein HINF_LOCUS34580 [Hexamita inflata]
MAIQASQLYEIIVTEKSCEDRIDVVRTNNIFSGPTRIRKWSHFIISFQITPEAPTAVLLISNHGPINSIANCGAVIYFSHHYIQMQTYNHLYLERDPNLSAVSCSASILSGSSRVVADVRLWESTCPPRPALQTKFNTSIESGVANANRVQTQPTPRQIGAAFTFQFNTSIESGLAHKWKNLRPPSDWGLLHIWMQFWFLAPLRCSQRD